MSETWSVSYEDEVEGKRLAVGFSFAVHGESGKRYNYIRTVTNEQGESWVDCFGGSKARPKSRAVHHEDIKPKSIKEERVVMPKMVGPTPRRGRR